MGDILCKDKYRGFRHAKMQMMKRFSARPKTDLSDSILPFVDGTVNTGQTDEYIFRRGNTFWFAYRFQPERFSEIDRASAFHNIPDISYLLSGGKDVPCAVPLRFCRKYAEHLEDCGKDTYIRRGL